MSPAAGASAAARRALLAGFVGLLTGGCSLTLEGTQAPLLSVHDSGAPHTLVPDAGFDSEVDPIVVDAGDGSCNLSGSFGLRAEIDVTWTGTSIGNVVPVLAAGAGKLEIITLINFERADDHWTGHVRACSVTTPDFASYTVGEVYGVEFPTTLWEAPAMPHWDVPIYTSCLQPNCKIVSDSLNALLGVALLDPQAKWPAARTDPALSFPDHDGDGQPGLTINALQGLGYSYPPVNIVSGARASEIMLGIRFSTVFQGNFATCDRLTGVGPGTRVDTRAATCIMVDNGVQKPCGTQDAPPLITSEATFLDGNLPKWQVVDTNWTGVRLADKADCAAARAASY